MGAALSPPLSGGCCLYGGEDDPSRPPALFSCLSAPESPRPPSRWRPGRVRQLRSTSFLPLSLHQTETDSASTALLVAAFSGREDKVQDLLERKETNPNVSYSNGNTPLIIAVQENHTSIVHLLLKRSDILVNMRGLDGYTALIRAAYERSDLVKLLIQRPDVDVNLSTYYGTTALTFAIRNGNVSAVRELIKHPNINVNYQSKHGENALFEAVSYKRMDLVEALLSHPKLEVDLVDQHDRTPFLVACQYGYDDIAISLIRAGCDPTVEDDCGRNGLYHAVKRKREMIVQALLDRRDPYSLKCQCRTVIRSYTRSIIGPGGSVRTRINNIPRQELPASLRSFLTFQS